MKKVPLKKVTRAGSNDAKLDYRDQIVLILRQPENPQAGINYEEMGKSLAIIKKLQDFEYPEVGEGFIELEDAEHEIVARRLKKAPWLTVDESLYEMIGEIADAEKVA